MKWQIHIDDNIKIILSFNILPVLNVLSSKDEQIVTILGCQMSLCYMKYVKHTCLENIMLSRTKEVDVGKVYRVGRHDLGLPWLLIDRSPACP